MLIGYKTELNEFDQNKEKKSQGLDSISVDEWVDDVLL